MNNLKLVTLNLQQTLIVDSESNDWNGVCGIHTKSKKLLVIHPSISRIIERTTEEYQQEIEEVVKKGELEYDKVIFGDGFICDTWDKKIYEM
jgi:hypothetical protein